MYCLCGTVTILPVRGGYRLRGFVYKYMTLCTPVCLLSILFSLFLCTRQPHSQSPHQPSHSRSCITSHSHRPKSRRSKSRSHSSCTQRSKSRSPRRKSMSQSPPRRRSRSRSPRHSNSSRHRSKSQSHRSR